MNDLGKFDHHLTETELGTMVFFWGNHLLLWPNSSSWQIIITYPDIVDKGRFPKIGVPILAGWFPIENPTRMDDLGYPYFRKPPCAFRGETHRETTFQWHFQEQTWRFNQENNVEFEEKTLDESNKHED